MEEKEEKRHQDQRRFLIVGTCIFDSPSAFFSTSTNDMTASEQLDETLSLQPLPNFTHIITIPFPSPRVQTQLTVHLTLFNGPSILLWCGECAEGWTDSSEESSVEQATATSAPSSSLLIEENPPPRSLPSTQELPPVTGRLASEWAVAMSNTRTKLTNSTSLYRSNADLAKPMSARLSKRFSIAQLFLSLSLPSHIISALDGPYSGSEGGKALLLIEGALIDILKQTLSTL